jgi:transmembrane sensor
VSEANFAESTRFDRLEEASQWLQRIRDAGDDEQLLDAWLEWCQRHPMNQQAFDEMVVVWELSGKSKQARAATGASRATGMGRRMAIAATLTGLAVAATFGAWWTTRSSPPLQMVEYASPVGTNSVQRLADGSALELGGGTRVTVVMSGIGRQVQLHEGELYVAVHPDASRPFHVAAGRLEVTATGTAFNVLRTEGRTTVTVVEGSVEAAYEGRGSPAPNVQLEPGQQLVYSHASHSVIVRQADPRDAIAWRSGMLNFHDEPLSEVIATVNRYAARQILIEDPGIRDLSFTGTARTDRLESWLGALPHAFPVVVAERRDGRMLIGPRPGGAAD